MYKVKTELGPPMGCQLDNSFMQMEGGHFATWKLEPLCKTLDGGFTSRRGLGY